jgi:hypothetical protein
MPKMQKRINTRDKGSKFEFEIQRWMKDRLINFRRITLSGQLYGEKGDCIWIENGKQFRGECKCGQQVPEWIYKTLEKDNNDFLVVRKDRKQRLWVLPDRLLELLLKPNEEPK